MNRNLKKGGLIFTFILALGGAVYLGYDLNVNSKDKSVAIGKTHLNLREDVVIFENTFFDFLSERFDELREKDAPAITDEQLDSLVKEAITMVDLFSAEFSPNEDERARLERLRFYTYLNIATDEVESKKTLDRLPASEMKFALLQNYVEAFTKLLGEKGMKSYLEKQLWANTYDPDFSKNIASTLFFTDPIGKDFPDYIKNYFDMSGVKHKVSDYRGKYVLIDFWATWCVPCLAELPYLIDGYNQYGANGRKQKNKFEIISFSFDQDLSVLKKFLKERQLKWVQYFDGKAYRGELVSEYKVNKLPTTYLLDPQGKVIAENLSGRRLLSLLQVGIEQAQN